MHHNTFICTDCRRTRRSLLWKNCAYVRHNCPECGKAMYALQSKWRIPPRTDKAAWEDMRFAITCFETARADSRARLSSATELDEKQPLSVPARVARPKFRSETRRQRRERAERPAVLARHKALQVRTSKVTSEAPMPFYYYGAKYRCRSEEATFVENEGNKFPRYSTWSNPPPEPWILNVFPRRSGRVSARIRAT